MQDSDLDIKIPNHVAVIMDGNGRWAKKRGLPRSAGHKQGVEAARRVVRAAGDIGIGYITLFGFSTENWNRPENEIKELMTLLRFYLRSETADLHKQGARLRVIGDREALDDDIVSLIENAEALTADNTNITVIIALNYGGRYDIVQAAKAMALEHGDDLQNIAHENLSALFQGYLMTGSVPDPDLLIRTSGEKRISNFLLWQCAYSEFVFSEVLWPDFGKAELQDAIEVYRQRDRRFGAVEASSV